MALTEGDRANLLALEIIQRQLVQLTFAVVENATRHAPAPAAQSAEGADKKTRRAGSAADALANQFGRLLGPLVVFGSLLTAPTSGLSVFNKALGLFAASIAPLLLPVLFTLAVGLAGASDVIFKKVVPALDGFSKFVLNTGIPVMAAFAETCGRAVQTLDELANTKLGRAAGDVISSGTESGGMLGALNRSFDRLGRLFDSSVPDPDAGRGTIESLERTAGDYARMLPAGDRAVGAFTWARRNLGLGGEESGGGTGTSAETTAAMDRARMDTLRELQISMLPKVSVGGSAAGVFTRAQQAAVGASPFERRMLEMMSEVVTIMVREAGRPEAAPGGALTPADRERIDRIREEMRRRGRA